MHRHLSLHILVAASAILFCYLLWPYLTPLVLATIMAVLGTPLYDRFKKLLRDKGSLSAFFTTATMVIVIGIPLALLITLVTKEAIDVVVSLRNYATEENIQNVTENEDLVAFKEKLQTIGFGVDLQKIQEAVLTTVKQMGTKLVQHAGALAAGIAHGTINFIIFVIALFFLLRDGDKLITYFRESPYVENHVLDKLKSRFKEVTDAIVFGNLVIAALQGVVVALGFFAFGLNNGLLAGLVTALFALIPAIGPLVIILPATVFLGLSTGWGIALTFGIVIEVLCILIDNLLKPILLERRLRIHSLIIFLSLIGGISAFGLLGILYGPLIAALFLTLLDLWAKEV